jgi:hypothetical protein
MSEEYYSKPNVERPLGVTIIALIGIVYFSIFIISILLLSFLALFAPAGGGEILGFEILSFILLLIGVAQFAVSYGLWKMKRWALRIQIGLYILNMGLSVLELIFFPPLLVILVIPIGIILYLNSKKNLFS